MIKKLSALFCLVFALAYGALAENTPILLKSLVEGDQSKVESVLRAQAEGAVIDLNGMNYSDEEIASLLKAHPQIAFRYQIKAFDQSWDQDASEIDLKEVQVTDFAALRPFLSCFPKLTRFDMFSTLITKEEMDALSALFPEIRFGWTFKIAEHTLRTDMTAFSTLHSKRSIEHSSEQFEALKYCRDLQALDIGHNKVTDISFLRYLPNLRVLIIALNYITDISEVGKLEKLEYLEMFRNRVTDLSPLKNLKNLVDLNICFNKVKDYSPILELKKLERLWVYNSNGYSTNNMTDPKVVEMLKQALPNCHVDGISYSTLGGWREHPRYFVINDVFKSFKYRPFEPTGQ